MPKPEKRTMAGRPPVPASVEDFIGGEEITNPSTQAVAPEEYPWEAPHVRDDVIKSVNLRLPEPYILKLKYLSEQTNISQQRLIREILCPAVDQRITELND